MTTNDTPTFPTIEEAAQYVVNNLTYIVRDDGTTTYWTDNADLYDILHGMMSQCDDDMSMQLVRDALSGVIQGDEDPSEPDVYTVNLTGWLASNIQRVAYLDDVMEDFGEWTSTAFDLLQAGQAEEIRETWCNVRAVLEEMVAEDDEDDEEQA